jgi:RND family efflux transporter MFP subunit
MRAVILAAMIALAAPWARAQEVETCILKPRELVHLGSAVSGLIVEIAAERGDAVRKGQVVARLESTIEESTLALARAKASNDAAIMGERAEYDMLSRKVDRTAPLAEKMIASAATLDEARAKLEESRNRLRAAEMDRALAALDADRARRQLDQRQVRSSIDGVVTERKLAAGEFVYEQTPIMTIAQLDPLNVEVVLPAARYGSVRVGDMAEVRPAPPVGGMYRARVEVVDPVIDAASDTFGVRLVLANPGNAIPAGFRCAVIWPGAPQ